MILFEEHPTSAGKQSWKFIYQVGFNSLLGYTPAETRKERQSVLNNNSENFISVKYDVESISAPVTSSSGVWGYRDEGMRSGGPAQGPRQHSAVPQAGQDLRHPTRHGRSSGARGLCRGTAGGSIPPPHASAPPGLAAPGGLRAQTLRRAACAAPAPSPGAGTSGSRRHIDRGPGARRGCATASSSLPRRQLLTCQMAKKMRAAVSSSASM